MAESAPSPIPADDVVTSKGQQYPSTTEVIDDCDYEKSDESKACLILLKNAYMDKNFKLADEIIEDMVTKSLVKGLTKLHTASGYGLYELVEKYLEDKMDPNAECSFNDLSSITPIHFCSGIGPDSITADRHKCIELLVKHGASVNRLTSRDDTALHWATKLADLKTCAQLVKCGIDVNKLNVDNCTCAHGAAFYKNIDVLELLIDSKTDVNIKDISGKNILHLLCKDSYEDNTYSSNSESGQNEQNEENEKNVKFIRFINRLLDECKMDPNEKDSSDSTPLMYACEQQNLELIQTLIDHKADVNIINNEGFTCMLLAIVNSCSKVVQLLLKNGFDLKNRNPNNSYITDAAYLNDAEILTTLLDAGCDVNETREDENGVILNPLWAACERTNLAIVEILLQRGANPIIRADMTALHCTAMAQYESLPIAKLLVEYKCPINLKSEQAGETPLFLASNSGYSEIVDFLLSLGVDPNDSSPQTRSCFQQAVFRGHKDIILLLLNKGYKLTEEDKNDLNLYIMDLYQDGDIDMINFLLSKDLTSKEKILECIKKVHTWHLTQTSQEEVSASSSHNQLEDSSGVATLSDLKLDLAQSYPVTVEELDLYLSSKSNLNVSNSSEEHDEELK